MRQRVSGPLCNSYAREMQTITQMMLLVVLFDPVFLLGAVRALGMVANDAARVDVLRILLTAAVAIPHYDQDVLPRL